MICSSCKKFVFYNKEWYIIISPAEQEYHIKLKHYDTNLGETISTILFKTNSNSFMCETCKMIKDIIQ